jgi:hypothetical protein
MYTKRNDVRLTTKCECESWSNVNAEAEVFALIVAIPLVSVRYWLWRKPGAP